MKIAVIGGGPMGLATAYYLTQQNHQVSLFEKDDRLGGMSASIIFNDILIEKYYHFINLPDHDLFELLKELGIYDDLRWTDTKMGIYTFDKKSGLPQVFAWGDPLSLFKYPNVSFITKFRYGLHAFYSKFICKLEKLDKISASSWFKKWQGEEGYGELWKFLFEKKFFELSDPLSAAWIATRMRRVANSRRNILQESLGYLEGGTESLIKKLEQKILEKNGQILLNNEVLKVNIENDQVKSIVTKTGQENFDVVISTIPLPYVTKLVPSLAKDYAQKIEAVKNVSVACAVFCFDRSITQNFWLNINIPEWDIPGIIEYSNLRPMQNSYVYVPYYMPKTHANWGKSDAELLQQAKGYIQQINPTAKEIKSELFRYEYAQPVCPPNFYEKLPSVETKIKGLFIADTTHSFPEDRSIQESVKIAKKLARLVE